MPIRTLLEALVKTSFAMRSALRNQELMSKSFWRSIEVHRNRSHFSPSVTMVREFRKTLSRQSFSPFSEYTATRKHRGGMALAWRSPRKRFGCMAERYGPRILFPRASKSRSNCQGHMTLQSTPMRCLNQSTAPRYEPVASALGGSSVLGHKRRLANRETQQVQHLGNRAELKYRPQ